MVITTASRPETQDWVRQCSAHHVINHRQPLAPQVAALGLGAPSFVFAITQTDQLGRYRRTDSTAGPLWPD